MEAEGPSVLRVSRDGLRECEGDSVKGADGSRVDFSGKGGEEFPTGGDDASSGCAMKVDGC